VRSNAQEDVVEIQVEEVERLGVLFDAEEELAEVVLFTIVSELLIYEGNEGSTKYVTWKFTVNQTNLI
jgi:hypothetical protein